MSLLTESMEACVMRDKTTVSDGYGGITTAYVDGAQFDAAIARASSVEAKIAATQGVKDLYTVITSRTINLQYHDAFKRLSDGKIFRVTSDGDDNKTPQSASLDMRAVSAEEWHES